MVPEKITQAHLDDARAIFRAHYYRRVTELATLFIEQLKSGEFKTSDAFQETFDREIEEEFTKDSVRHAYESVGASDISSEVLEEIAEMGVGTNDSTFMVRWATECLCREVMVKIDEINVTPVGDYFPSEQSHA